PPASVLPAGDPHAAGGGLDLDGALNLGKLAQLARRHESEGGTFRTFARRLRQGLEEGEREPDAEVLPTEENAVRLMTIHAAKGLEFPIVVLADLAHEHGPPGRFVVDRRHGRAEIRLKGEGGLPLDSHGYEAARKAEKEELLRERKRL